MTANKDDIWSADTYGNKVAPFVATLTEKIVSWLEPQPTDQILDVGCGEGVLTAKLSQHVNRIVGIDASPNMISHFQTTHPTIDCRVVDCRYLDSDSELTTASFDKVFSNAALHWILRDPTTRLNCLRGCFEALKPGGVFVSESGAFGNVAEVHASLISGLVLEGVPVEKARDASPWWFPTVEALRGVLEEVGFSWERGETELRQTRLTEGDGGGVEGWIRLFGEPFLQVLSDEEARERVVRHAVAVLEGVGRRQDGGFSVNYVRIRFVARKPF